MSKPSYCKNSLLSVILDYVKATPGEMNCPKSVHTYVDVFIAYGIVWRREGKQKKKQTTCRVIRLVVEGSCPWNSHYQGGNHFISLCLLFSLSTSTQISPLVMFADPYRTPLCLNSSLGSFSRRCTWFLTSIQEKMLFKILKSKF